MWYDDIYLLQNNGNPVNSNSVINTSGTYTSEQVDNVDIEGCVIYYIDGETWTDAINNYPTKNSGWSIDGNKVKFGGKVLKDDDSDMEVDPSSAIDPSTYYKWE